MNEEIIGIEVSGEIYPIKDEETSGKAQTLETKVSTAEENITNLETASTEHGEKIAQIEANIGETDIQELKSLVDSHEEELKELKELIDDTTISESKTWSSEKINESSVKKIGDLTELKTINKSNLVSAINEVSQSSGGNVYSTEETVCGTWHDGRPIYRKAFYSATNTFNNATQFVLPNADAITNSGILYRKGATSAEPVVNPIRGSGESSYVTLSWYVGDAFGAGTSWWCEYVKTTD